MAEVKPALLGVVGCSGRPGVRVTSGLLPSDVDGEGPVPIAASHKYDYRASWERLRAAQDLLEDVPVLSLYLSGLTVECMLRAWLDPNRPFDGRHHLPSLLEESTILHELGGDARQQVTVAVKDRTLLWTNSIRYYPEDRVAQELKKLRPYRNKRKSSTKGWKGLVRLAAQEASRHVYGTIVSGAFAGVDEAERQREFYTLVESKLGADTRRKLLVIFTNTPEEDVVFERDREHHVG